MRSLDRRARRLAAAAFCAASASACRTAAPPTRTEPSRPIDQSAAAENPMLIPQLTPSHARNLLDKNDGYLYLDVRSVPEFNAGHAPGAFNIPLAEPNPDTGRLEPNPHFLAVVQSVIPRDAKLIVGCRSGGRSMRASAMLLQAGYADVANLAGGFGGGPAPDGSADIAGWSQLGFPVETGDGGERSYARLRESVR